MLTGVTTNTKSNYQLGAGVICTGYTQGGGGTITGILGATRGGGSFTAVPEKRQAAMDGLPNNTKGFEIIDFWTATLNTTIIETTEDTIKLALAGATATTETDVTTIKAKQGIIEGSAYADLYWVGDTSDGKKIVIELKNALNSNGFNFTFADRGEGTFDIVAIANYDVSDLSEPPFTIYLDKSTQVVEEDTTTS